MRLDTLLSRILLKDHSFQLVQLQSPPCECDHIIAVDELKKDPTQVKTVKSEHFITISYNEKVFYALEVMVYIIVDNVDAKAERFIFISKADTSGYCDVKVSTRLITRAILEYLISIDPLHYLAKVQLLDKEDVSNEESPSATSKDKPENQTDVEVGAGSHVDQKIKEPTFVFIDCPYQFITKISLFTRAEAQYLFPDSADSPNKHLLSGQKLLRWWLSIIDDLLSTNFESDSIARLQIPGEEKKTINLYLRNMQFKNWQVGDIFHDSEDELAMYRIPVFEDDPKGRFLSELEQEGRVAAVKFSTFWLEIQARSEFRLGALVSVIGARGRYKGVYTRPEDDEVVILSTMKKYFSRKHKITKEGYDTVEGAIKAHRNLRDLLRKRDNAEMLHVDGSSDSIYNANTPAISLNPETEKNSNAHAVQKRPPINNLNAFVVRKKPKATKNA
ncbi:HHR002Cp [Eremothecium sinecaudum]|uniref:histone acetyltransferase n=1 Tax=Eremothecium sinecaudum TaxID=45286 RepID=A0A109V0H0_9SACH|nr:HHR002Cp [Eremothecium sinecaudum]AMD22771.1 HHR002Cp [Eremothecium sinecaudum]